MHVKWTVFHWKLDWNILWTCEKFIIQWSSRKTTFFVEKTTFFIEKTTFFVEKQNFLSKKTKFLIITCCYMSRCRKNSMSKIEKKNNVKNRFSYHFPRFFVKLTRVRYAKLIIIHSIILLFHEMHLSSSWTHRLFNTVCRTNRNESEFTQLISFVIRHYWRRIINIVNNNSPVQQ